MAASDAEFRARIKLDGDKEAIGALEDVAQAGEKVDGEEFEAKAAVDAGDAVDDLETVNTEGQKLDGETFEARADVDTEAATDGLQDVTKAGEKLDGETFKAKVDADTDSAKRDLDAVFELTDKLGRTAAKLVLSDNAKSIEQDIADLVLELDKLSAPAEIKIKTDQINALETDLGRVNTKIDELGGREVDIQTGRAREGLDGVAKSADSSKSVLANMVGNATQDLGALGGIAGSTGVAIGQMGEYMADARASGDGLGSILKNFSGVALPILGISVGIGLITKAFEASKEKAKALAEQTRKVVDELLKAQDAGEGAADALQGLGDEAATNKFKDLGDDLQPTLDQLDALGLTWADVVEAFATGTGPVADAITDFRSMDAAITASTISGAGYVDVWALIAESHGISEEAAKKLFSQEKILNDVMGDQVSAQDEAVASGRSLTDFRQDYADAQRAGAKAAEADVKAQEDAAEAYAEVGQAALDNQKKLQEAAQAADDNAAALIDARDALGELANAFSTLQINADALSSVFALGNAPLDAAADVRDISLAIDDLSESAKGVAIGDVLAGNVKGDKVLDAIDALRPQIQERITAAFASGGPEAATTMAHDYITQVANELGVSEIEAAKLLGLEDVEAIIKVAVDQASKAKAKRELDILIGLGGETPFTAGVALALEAGTITGDQALLLVQNALGTGFHVPIPQELLPPDNTPEALAAAQAALAASPPLQALSSFDATGAATGATDWAAGPHDPAIIGSGLDIETATSQAGAFAAGPHDPAILDLGVNPEPAETGVDAFVGDVDGTTATASLDADPDKAETATDGWWSSTSRLVAKAILDANRQPADTQASGFRTDTEKAPANMLLGTVPSNLSGVRTVFDGVANPNGSPRTANITAVVNDDQAIRDLNNLVAARTVTIRPSVVPSSVLVRVSGGG